MRTFTVKSFKRKSTEAASGIAELPNCVELPQNQGSCQNLQTYVLQSDSFLKVEGVWSLAPEYASEVSGANTYGRYEVFENTATSTPRYVQIERHLAKDHEELCDPERRLEDRSGNTLFGKSLPVNIENKHGNETNATQGIADLNMPQNQVIVKVEFPKEELQKNNLSSHHQLLCSNGSEKEQGHTEETFTNNELKHVSSALYKCSLCDNFFEDEISLVTHESLHDHAGNDEENEEQNPQDDDQANDYLSNLKGSGDFTCDTCPQSFPRQHLLRVHALKVHGENAFPCLICGEKCPTRRSLTKHKQVHVVDGAFKCETCGFSQAKYSNFLRHLKLHSGTRDYTCEWCGKSFTTSTVLIRHRRRHTGEKPYSCEECGECFARLYGLRVHQSKHVGRGYKCTEENCSKAFYSKSALNNHLKSHLPERPYKCVACGLGFYMSSHYKDHLRKHTGERPFVCNVCSKTFARKSELVIHERVHTGERPFSCSLCDKAFMQKSILKQHLLTHSKAAPLKCSKCDRIFKHNGALKRHQKCAHDTCYESQDSSDSFSSNESEDNGDLDHSLRNMSGESEVEHALKTVDNSS